ncbi:MAG: 23S rRNA (adenine(2503)-C(2))-methyltransferase RlmN [Gemmatimonadetes bacterium]|nr:MAG: 23S rRNA (adenine(2503)-C(2))-methyltransferase RlmN [Gemmatimonadota bacterium]
MDTRCGRAVRRHGGPHRGARDPVLLALRRERCRPGLLGGDRLPGVARSAVAGRRRGHIARPLRDHVDARLHPRPPGRRRIRARRPLCHRSARRARGELQRGALALRGGARAGHRPLPSHHGGEPRRRRPRRVVSRGRGGVVAVTDLLSLTPDAARAAVAPWLAARSEPAYRGSQIVARLWQRPVASWEEATELPTALRRALAEAFPLRRLRLVTRQLSRDGTEKFLWQLEDGEAIESVLIPEGKRRTLCISSQVGCALGCVFCATGRMGFRRNLAPAEIAGQVRELLLSPAGQAPTNVVFMGMGEPLLNWEAVDASLTILNHPDGFGIGARHITVSTVGILANLAKLARRPEQFRLALSLHAPTSALRLALMPIEKKYALPDVVQALQQFRRRVTLEYVLIGGRNDDLETADHLAGLAKPLGALVNLLPLHPGGAPDLTPSSRRRMLEFERRLRSRGVEAVLRRSRGLDISAACGQLRVELEPRRKVRAEEHARVE